MRYRAWAPLRIDFGGGWTDVPLYAEAEGGAVLSAAITHYARGVLAQPSPSFLFERILARKRYLSYTVDLPSSSGLGSSAAQTVVWVALVRAATGNTADRTEVASAACSIASSLGIMGGKQDEYAAALGGIRYYSFSETIEAEPLALPAWCMSDLRSRLVLVSTGESRLSSDVHKQVWERYLNGASSTINALSSLKRIAADMKTALINHDLDAFGSLLSENWKAQKALHPAISTPSLEQLFSLATKSGAIAGKACGAGGGGCVLFMTGKDERSRLSATLAAHGVKVIDFDFDTRGVQVTNARVRYR